MSTWRPELSGLGVGQARARRTPRCARPIDTAEIPLTLGVSAARRAGGASSLADTDRSTGEASAEEALAAVEMITDRMWIHRSLGWRPRPLQPFGRSR